MEQDRSEASNGVSGKPAVVIAGGGLGAVEAALALRAFLGERVAVELVAPGDELVYEPLTVLEPFGREARHRLPLAGLARTHAVRHRRAAVTGVDPRRASRARRGASLAYDALIVATGARGERWLDGAVVFGGAEDVDSYRELLGRVEGGDVRHLLFAAETGSAWPLALYDLALLTAGWAGERGVEELRRRSPPPRTSRSRCSARGVACGARGAGRPRDRGPDRDRRGRRRRAGSSSAANARCAPAPS